TILHRVPHNVQLDGHQTALLRVELQPLSAARAEARALTDLPQGRYTVAMAPDYVSTLLPHVQDVQDLANLWDHDVILRLLDRLEHDLTLGQVTKGFGMVQQGLPGLDWLNKASYKYAHAALLRYLTQAVEIARLPAEQSGPRLAELDKQLERLPWLARLMG